MEARREGQYASWTVWSVPTTMTVADAAQRTGMSESDLRAMNNIPPRMLIKAGSALMVPRSVTTREDVSSHLADNGQLAFAPEIVTRRTTVRARKGETVASVARRYNLSASSVADWNDVKSSAAFKLGQQIVVYLPVRAATAAANQVRSSNVRNVVQARGNKQSGAKAPPSAPAKRGGTPSKVKKR
jgi:membrane-bound lytic murein transglycosylase D